MKATDDRHGCSTSVTDAVRTPGVWMDICEGWNSDVDLELPENVNNPSLCCTSKLASGPIEFQVI